MALRTRDVSLFIVRVQTVELPSRRVAACGTAMRENRCSKSQTVSIATRIMSQQTRNKQTGSINHGVSSSIHASPFHSCRVASKLHRSFFPDARLHKSYLPCCEPQQYLVPDSNVQPWVQFQMHGESCKEGHDREREKRMSRFFSVRRYNPIVTPQIACGDAIELQLELAHGVVHRTKQGEPAGRTSSTTPCQPRAIKTLRCRPYPPNNSSEPSPLRRTFAGLVYGLYLEVGESRKRPTPREAKYSAKARLCYRI